MSGMARPTGVTVIAILSFIGGILAILAGAATTLLGGLIGAATDSTVGGVFGGLFAVIGIVILVVGIAYIVAGYGLWRLRPWAWLVALVLSIVSLVFTILGIVGGGGLGASQIVSLAVAGVIIYYLNTPEIKQAFGR